MRILATIPALNEEQTLRNVIQAIRTNLPQGDVLVLNDGATGATGNVAKNHRVLILEHPYSMGT